MTEHKPAVASASARVAKPTVGGKRRTPAQLFDRNGLKASVASDTVLGMGPLRWGEDGRFWAYSGGLWAPGEEEVHARVVHALGDRYRPAHATTIRDVARARIDRIDCSPVPEYINFRNGLLDWKRGILMEHDPAIPSTVQLSIDWDGGAQCADFHRFLDDVIPADDQSRVWQLIGYMLMSGNPLHRAFLLAGSGRNGKGAFMRTVLALLGKSNVSNVTLHDLSINRFATAQLYGKTANVCGDIDSTYLENTGRIKEITGEDQVQAEHKFGQPFRFTAWCSMLFSANEIPGSADSSRGWVDRWEIISFPRYVGDRVDRSLEPRLQSAESLQGIAAGAVAALRTLMADEAFKVTDSSRLAKEDFARKSNPLYQYIEDRCKVAPAGWEKREVLYNDYVDWAGKSGLRQLSRPKFYEKLRQLGDRGVTEAKRNGVNGFKGISIGTF
jgi:putative DNA primase/helicase